MGEEDVRYGTDDMDGLDDRFEDDVDDGPSGFEVDDPESDSEGTLQIGRAQRRRLEAERIEDHAPQEGVKIFRKVDQAILVGLHLPGQSSHDVDASLDEMEQLLETAGGMVLLAGVASSTEAARYGGVVLLLLGTAASLVAHPGTPSAEGRDGQVESRTESHPVPPAPEGA